MTSYQRHNHCTEDKLSTSTVLLRRLVEHGYRMQGCNDSECVMRERIGSIHGIEEVRPTKVVIMPDS